MSSLRPIERFGWPSASDRQARPCVMAGRSIAGLLPCWDPCLGHYLFHLDPSGLREGRERACDSRMRIYPPFWRPFSRPLIDHLGAHQADELLDPSPNRRQQISYPSSLGQHTGSDPYENEAPTNHSSHSTAVVFHGFFYRICDIFHVCPCSGRIAHRPRRNAVGRIHTQDAL